jgi:hypothetical protein
MYIYKYLYLCIVVFYLFLKVSSNSSLIKQFLVNSNKKTTRKKKVTNKTNVFKANS